MDDVEAPDGRLLLLDEALTSEAGGVVMLWRTACGRP